MTKIAPLRAVVYNPQKIHDLSQVVCPPYDVISPVQQERLLNSSPQNFIHILLRKDSPGEDKYRRAKEIFTGWLKEKILIQEHDPAIYFYSQQYKLRGENKTRLGFIVRLYLEEKNNPVFGHEHTRLEPKEDRLRLLREVRANLSPIFAVFKDKKRIIRRMQENYLQSTAPLLEVTDQDKVAHRLWRISDPEALKRITEALAGENIFIADGHHRYEVACAFREEMRKKLGGIIKGDEDFNYVLSYFTNADSQGLTIMPINRLVKLKPDFDFEACKNTLKTYFDVEEVKTKARFFLLLEKAGTAEHVIGMYKDKKFWLLRLKNIKILDKIINDKPKEYRQLDVAILNYLVLKQALGLDIENKESIIYHPDAEGLIAQADELGGALVFILNPVKIQQIMDLALTGEKMPSKSTYFYPKVLSGLVINKFEDI